MAKNKGKKDILTFLVITAMILAGVFVCFFSNSPQAEAAKKTKWQKLLEKNGIPENLWSKYKPKVTRSEYNKVTRGTSVSAAKKSKSTKWQRLLERNNVSQSLWSKYLPKVSRKEYKKTIKVLQRLSGASSGSLGPEMKVGLFKLSSSNQKRIEVRAENGFEIRNRNGTVLKSVAPNTKNRIKVLSKEFGIKQDDSQYVESGNYLTVEALNGGALEIYDCNHQTNGEKKQDPNGCHASGSVEYNKFRGKLELSFNDDGTPWVINVLPMEQYTWGTGEIGDSKSEYYKVFSIIFRTYAMYHTDKGTKHADENFTLTDTSSDQIYKGYKIEERFPKMKEATQDTRGKVVAYKGKVALTPYCSYTNGKTRDMKGYPYLESVKDHKKGTKKNLKPGDDGNHMYGLSAHGAVGYVGDGKSYTWVLKHYYTGVKIEEMY